MDFSTLILCYIHYVWYGLDLDIIFPDISIEYRHITYLWISLVITL